MDLIYNNNLNEYLSQSYSTVPIFEFIFNFLLAALISYYVKLIFIKYGKTLSNREVFSNNFIPLALTTMIIITIVKSSLALSLGLVGALSIVRFRTAIKEPEELLFLFICITIGLGFGANQPLLTSIGILLLSLVLILTRKNLKSEYVSNIILLKINKTDGKDINIERVIEILKESSEEVDLKQLEENLESKDLTFIIKIKNIDNLIKLKNKLHLLDKKLDISFHETSKFF